MDSAGGARQCGVVFLSPPVITSNRGALVITLHDVQASEYEIELASVTTGVSRLISRVPFATLGGFTDGESVRARARARGMVGGHWSKWTRARYAAQDRA